MDPFRLNQKAGEFRCLTPITFFYPSHDSAEKKAPPTRGLRVPTSEMDECGRRPGKDFLTFRQHSSGAATCAASPVFISMLLVATG